MQKDPTKHLIDINVIKFWGKKLNIYQLIFFISLEKISDFQTDFFFQNQHIFTQKELYFVIYPKKGSEKI